jgi:prepilin-type N-terminal cleavage/methylation domain-containing protein
MNNCQVSSEGSGRGFAGKGFGAKGFTLVELLVVMGILVLLAAILIPTVSRAWRSAQITSERADLATLTTALKAYAADFEDYPRNPSLPRDTTNGMNVAPFYSLAIALLGPGPAITPVGVNSQLGDGADGLGFRTKYSLNASTGISSPSGKVWGPYISADNFKVAWEMPTNDPASVTAEQPVILDRWGTAIQYFPRYGPISNRNAVANVTAGPLYGISTPATMSPQGINAFFDQRDATNVWFANSATNARAFQYVLGDSNIDNYINSNETLKVTDPFVLISAGPDMLFCNIGANPANYPTNFLASGNVYSISQ